MKKTKLIISVLLSILLMASFTIPVLAEDIPNPSLVDDSGVVTLTGTTAVTAEMVQPNANGITCSEIHCAAPGPAIFSVSGADLSSIALYFDSGSWSLGSSITVSVVHVNSGGFAAGGFTVNSQEFYVGYDYNSAIPVECSISNSIINCPWFTVYRGLTSLIWHASGSTVNTRFFAAGGQIFQTVNLVNGSSAYYNLEDDAQIVRLTIQGFSGGGNTTTPVYIRGDNTVSSYNITGKASFLASYDGMSPINTKTKDVGKPHYQKASLLFGNVVVP